MSNKSSFFAPTTTHTSITFDLRILPKYQLMENLYLASQWKTIDFLPFVDIFTKKEVLAYQDRLSRAPALYYMHQLLSLDQHDLDEALEDPPVKMKRYLRIELIQAIDEVRIGTRMQPPPLPDQDLSTEALQQKQKRSILSIPVELFLEEHIGIHRAEWPIIPLQSAANVLVWFLLSLDREMFAHKTVIQLSSGACPIAGLALGKMNVTEQVVITENERNVKPYIFAALQANCNLAIDRGANICMQQLCWENNEDINMFMTSIDDKVDILIGSDILNYTLNCPRQLLRAAHAMMINSATARSDVKFYVSHNTRFGRSHLDSIETFCRDELEMKMTVIEWKTFIRTPLPVPIDTLGKREVVLLCFQLLYPN